MSVCLPTSGSVCPSIDVSVCLRLSLLISVFCVSCTETVFESVRKLFLSPSLFCLHPVHYILRSIYEGPVEKPLLDDRVSNFRPSFDQFGTFVKSIRTFDLNTRVQRLFPPRPRWKRHLHGYFYVERRVPKSTALKLLCGSVFNDPRRQVV